MQQPRGPWVFRSFDDLHHDLVDWLPRLPPICAVCGVPRSGVIVASQLATLLNVPLMSLDEIATPVKHLRPACSKPLRSKQGKLLIVDDSSWSGRAMSQTRDAVAESIFRDHILFGAAYANVATAHKLDCVGYTLDSINHLFAWNYLRDIHARTTLTDMDGVLCEDWTGDVNDENAADYQRFLVETKPRVLPIYELLGVVTGRVERHRAQTEAWLHRHRVTHGGLHMPFVDNESRRGACVGTRKAEIYAAESLATLFVESDVTQARVIHQRSGKPVLCSDTLELHQ